MHNLAFTNHALRVPALFCHALKLRICKGVRTTGSREFSEEKDRRKIRLVDYHNLNLTERLILFKIRADQNPTLNQGILVIVGRESGNHKFSDKLKQSVRKFGQK